MSRRHVLRVSFTVATDYGSEVAKERFEATLSLWTAPELDGPEPLAEIDPRRLDLGEIMDPVRKPPAEQVEEVERQIAEDLASIGGFPLEGRLELTRHFAGGEPRGSGRTVMLDRFEKVDVPASAFRVPAGFAERAPEVDPPRRSLPR
ncbi:MAG: hypothetical protein GY719_05805 [bacterium]|nr:hypothetical protein [bacterium]